MTAGLLSTLSLISYIAAAIFVALAVFIWFNYRILGVINDLTGKTARTTIEHTRAHNDATGKKSYRPSTFNIARGKLTGILSRERAKTVKLHTSEHEAITETLPETELFESPKYVEQSVETTALLDDRTELLNPQEETALLNETESLTNDEKIAHKASVTLTMVEDVVLTDTDEVIE